MRDLDVLVPSALLPSSSVAPDLARDLLRGLSLPALSHFVTHASRIAIFRLPDAAFLTTWQAWLFGERVGVAPEAVNLAELWAVACGIASAKGRAARWLLEPAHFRIARDHLRLDDPLRLTFTLDEARALAAVAAPILAEAGWRLEPLEPTTRRHWLATRDDGSALSGATIDRAIGDNVAAWQPRAPGSAAPDDTALAWRRCVNEIQMAWFAHPVNDAREARGEVIVNTLWLSGNGAAAAPLPRYAAVDSGLPLVAALPIDPDATAALETFDAFVEPARRQEWGVWRDALSTLDARIAAIIEQQRTGAIGNVTLVSCGSQRARIATLARRDLRSFRLAFWRGWTKKAPLNDWLTEPVAS